MGARERGREGERKRECSAIVNPACFYDQPPNLGKVKGRRAGLARPVTFIVGCDYFMTAMRLLRQNGWGGEEGQESAE